MNLVTHLNQIVLSKIDLFLTSRRLMNKNYLSLVFIFKC